MLIWQCAGCSGSLLKCHQLHFYKISSVMFVTVIHFCTSTVASQIQILFETREGPHLGISVVLTVNWSRTAFSSHYFDITLNWCHTKLMSLEGYHTEMTSHWFDTMLIWYHTNSASLSTVPHWIEFFLQLSPDHLSYCSSKCRQGSKSGLLG